MRASIIGAVATMVVLSGCVTYNSSEAIKPLPTDAIGTIKVGTIIIKSVPATVSAKFQPALEKALASRTKECARGKTELSLEVVVGEVKVRNAARAFLIGDSSVVKGRGRLFRPNTDETVADFDISHSVGGGGLLPAAAMAGEEGLADDFAVELCDQAFPKKRRH